MEITQFCCHCFFAKIPWNQRFHKEIIDCFHENYRVHCLGNTLWSLLNFCTYHLKIISWNQLYSKLFTKEIVFTEIFQKLVIQKFRKIHSVRELLFSWIQFIVKMLIWRNILWVRVNFRFSYSVRHTVNFTKFLYHDFLQNFRENNFFSKEFTI